MVATETIAPSVPAPDDFDGFWNARKAALKAMTAMAELKSVESPDPTIECFDLAIPCPQTKAARGYYARPKDCLLYTSDAADDLLCVDLGGRRLLKKHNSSTVSTTSL